MSEQMLIAHARIVAAAARVQARIAAMQASNIECLANGCALDYDKEAFLKVIDEEGVDCNSVQLEIQNAFR